MKKGLLIFMVLMVSNISIDAQENVESKTDLAFEFQAYPTGLLPGIVLEYGWNSRHAFEVKVGYNFLDHRDLGPHDSEIGGGAGGDIGYKYYFADDFSKWFLGARIGFWNNDIVWKNNDGTSGETRITVLQPTAIAGYMYKLNEHLFLKPFIGFGAEINVRTEGEEVGQGAILLLAADLAYRF